MVMKHRSRVLPKVTAALTGTKAEGQKTIFRVPKEDWAFVQKLKQYLNSDDYEIRTRFRGPRRGTSKYQTKKEDAEWFAIYINRR